MSGKPRKATIDFEIEFFKGVLEKSPGFVEAMMALADLYTVMGDLKEGLILDEKLSRMCPENPVVFYNLACSYSLLGDIDKAYRSFKRAVNCGYDDFDHIREDSDLDNLKKDTRFKKYLKRIQKKYGYAERQIFYEI